MRNSAAEIKRRLSLSDLLSRLGLEPDRAGFLSCPAHIDKTPSLKIYDNDKGWYCFGCGRGGTVIDFWMLYYRCDLKTALKEMGDLLGINENLSRTDRLEVWRAATKAKKEKQERKRKEKAKEFYYKKYLECKKVLEKDHEYFDDELVEACHNIAFYEHMSGMEDY